MKAGHLSTCCIRAELRLMPSSQVQITRSFCHLWTDAKCAELGDMIIFTTCWKSQCRPSQNPKGTPAVAEFQVSGHARPSAPPSRIAVAPCPSSALSLRWWAMCSLAARAWRTTTSGFARRLHCVPWHGAVAFVLLASRCRAASVAFRLVSVLVELGGLSYS
jgi:hypothetical protein